MTKTVYAEKKTTGRYKILKHCGSAAAATTLAALFGVIIYILISGIPHLSFNFLFGKYTGSNPTLAPALSGTLMLLVAALGIAVPIGIATAVFLTEYAAQRKGIVKLIRLAVETLAGIPSIIYGLFGYLVFVVEMGLGYSLLGGGITLAIMILPVIIRSAEESLLSVPKELKEASYALGARKVRTIFGVILPSAASGILTSVVLAAGRVISESAVLILTVGMLVNKMPENFFFPGTSLALNVYFFGSQGYPKQAAATGAALLIIVICINLTAGLLEKRLNKIKI
ncbi:MAG: phosphate ABC transporter permease PstA [Clostridiales bacterium]|nr:phosphate ABC transporter permease PstA [Clostridiales bacterium]